LVSLREEARLGRRHGKARPSCPHRWNR
jgi:hypothetical protein